METAPIRSMVLSLRGLGELIQDARMKRAGVSVSLAIAIASFGLSLSSVAAAQDEPATAEPPTPPPALQASGPQVADKPSESTIPHAEEENRWRATLDAVFGFGATPVVSQRIVGPLLSQESRTAETARFQTTSINLGLSYEVVDHLRVGALLPLGAGSLIPNETRGSTVVGNFTLGAEYEAHVRKNLVVFGGLDLALPTASGTELPEARDVSSLGHVDQTAFDRRSLLRAMSESRGREDSASFATDHFGIVPKVGALYNGMEKVELEGYVKYESLHATNSDASYEGGFIIAARGSYRFHKYADATLRAWTNLEVAGPDAAVLLVEPQVRFHFGAVMPIVGVILPVAGELTDPYAIGVRGSLAANF
jgi:hypothetical protein